MTEATHAEYHERWSPHWQDVRDGKIPKPTIAEYNRNNFEIISEIEGNKSAQFIMGYAVREQKSLGLRPSQIVSHIPYE